MSFIKVVAFSLTYLFSCVLFGVELAELEEALKKVPHSERPSLLMMIADEKFENLKQVSTNILRLRKNSREALIDKNKSERSEQDEELWEIFEKVFKMFENVRSEVSICASFDEERSFYGYSLFAQAYYDFTELFVQFVREDLFPKDWRYLNFDELKKGDTMEAHLPIKK